MKKLLDKKLKCPNCGFENKLKTWIEAEWEIEGCPHCDTYNFEETKLFKKYKELKHK